MSPLPSFRETILARSLAREQQPDHTKQQEVGRQQDVKHPTSPALQHRQGISAGSNISRMQSPLSFASRMEKMIQQKKAIPDTTNRAAHALHRYTQSVMQQALQNRYSSPSAEYLRVQRLQKMREKLQPRRQKAGRER